MTETERAPEMTTAEKTDPQPTTAETQKLPRWKRPSLWRTVVSVVLILCSLSLGGLAFVGLASLKPEPKRRDPVEQVYSVDVFQVKRYDLQEEIIAFGTALPLRQVQLTAQVSGEVMETIEPLKVGKKINAANATSTDDPNAEGDVILKIDSRNYQENVDQVEDQLREQEVELRRIKQEEMNLKRSLSLQQKNYETTQKEYERISRLASQGIVTQADLDQSELDLRRTEEAVVQLENELSLIPERVAGVNSKIRTNTNALELAKLDLQRTTVRSPFTGFISSVSIERGQYVRTGDALVEITDLSQIEVPVSVTLDNYQYLVNELLEGRTPIAQLAPNSEADAIWTGYVTRVSPVADQRTRTVQAYVMIDNRTQTTPLLPGTYVVARIHGPVYEDVIAIPRDALVEDQVVLFESDKAASGETSDSNAGHAKMVDVSVLKKINTIAILESGPKVDDSIVMTNLDVITQGSKVRTANSKPVQSLEAELSGKIQNVIRILESN